MAAVERLVGHSLSVARIDVPPPSSQQYRQEVPSSRRLCGGRGGASLPVATVASQKGSKTSSDKMVIDDTL
jgi:hypothetical protein